MYPSYIISSWRAEPWFTGCRLRRPKQCQAPPEYGPTRTITSTGERLDTHFGPSSSPRKQVLRIIPIYRCSQRGPGGFRGPPGSHRWYKGASTRTPAGTEVCGRDPLPTTTFGFTQWAPFASLSERPREAQGPAGTGEGTSPRPKWRPHPPNCSVWGSRGDAGRGEWARCDPGRAFPPGHSGAPAEARVLREAGDSARPRRPGPRGWQGAEERAEAQAGTTHLGQQAERARLALTLQQRRELLGGSLGEAEALERPFSPRDPEGKSQAPAAARAALSVTPPLAPSLPVSPPPEPLPSEASLVLRVGVLVGSSLLATGRASSPALGPQQPNSGREASARNLPRGRLL